MNIAWWQQGEVLLPLVTLLIFSATSIGALIGRRWEIRRAKKHAIINIRSEHWKVLDSWQLTCERLAANLYVARDFETWTSEEETTELLVQWGAETTSAVGAAEALGIRLTLIPLIKASREAVDEFLDQEKAVPPQVMTHAFAAVRSKLLELRIAEE